MGDQRDDISNNGPTNGETEIDYCTTIEQNSGMDESKLRNKETSFLNVVIKQPQNGSKRKVSNGDLNVFIPDRQMSLNEAILQGEAYFGPKHLEINIHETQSVKENGVHLNISVPERKLSFTQVIPMNE